MQVKKTSNKYLYLFIGLCWRISAFCRICWL